MAARHDNDHDLLIRIDENLLNLKREFDEFQKRLDGKANMAEIARVDSEIATLKTQTISLSRYMWGAVGIIGFIQLAAAVIVAIHYLRTL